MDTRTRKIAVIGGVSGAVIVLIAVVVVWQLSTFTMIGTVTTGGGGVIGEADYSCDSSFSRLDNGEQVTVYDSVGKPVAGAALESPVDVMGMRCQYSFTAHNVPRGEPSYTIQIGSDNPVVVSSEQAQRPELWVRF